MPSGVDLVQLSYLSWLESQEQDRAAKYAMFRSYYEGEHETQLTARQRKYLELRSEQDFSLNYCPIVVDALAEKLKITGFECDDQPELLWEWWRKARMDGVQGVVHTAAVRDGDTYVLVEWSNEHGRPVWTQENAYDGSQGLHIVYSDERRNVPMVAIKRWIVTSGANVTTRRTNLYWPDRIEKYADDGGSNSYWRPFEEQGQPWPIPWTRSGGAPRGIPVFHFRNKDQGYSYGESELEDVVPVQNGLNKSFIDLFAAADATGFRIMTMVGGDPTNITVAPGGWVYMTDPAGKITAIDGADLTGLVSLKDSIAAEIGKITRTPLSYFQLTGQVTAADTLKQQEAGLLSKATDRAVTFGNSWEDALYMARKLHNDFGPGGLDEEAEISAVWKDFETRNELDHLNGLKAKAELGVPQETIWREMGYNADDIERMKAEKAAEEAAGITTLGTALVANERAFNAGAVA